MAENHWSPLYDDVMRTGGSRVIKGKVNNEKGIVRIRVTFRAVANYSLFTIHFYLFLFLYVMFREKTRLTK